MIASSGFIFSLLLNAPPVPSVIAPAANQMNVNEHPTFLFSGCQAPVSCRLVIDTNSNCQGTSKIFTGINSNSYVLADGVNLQYGTTFFACASATDGSGTSAPSTPLRFTTRNVAVATPILSVNTRNSAQSPSGQSQILLTGNNGEQFAKARIYMKRLSGDKEVGVANILGDANGSFSFATDVTLFASDAGPRVYYATIERSDKSSSAPSNPVTFYYDPKYSLPAPTLKIDAINDLSGNQITGALKWAPISGGVSYEIYRRNGFETCTPTAAVSCYLTKPFTRIASLSNPAISGDGNIHYQDPTIGIASNGDGISYFVVTIGANTDRSNRSNAVNFKDIVAPRRSSLELLQVLATRTGRSIQFFYSNVDAGGFLNADNSPDLTARVQYFARANDPACPADSTAFATAFLDPSKKGVQTSLPFDALQNYTDYSSSIDNWIFAGEILDLDPDSPYCFQVCLQDHGRTEANCSVGSGRTLLDSVAPQFNGLSSATPLQDGRSVEVKWNLAKEDQTSREVIQYQIQHTNLFNSDGSPQFKDPLADNDLIVAQPGVSSISILNLLTGTKYCFQATAIDNAVPNPNRNTPLDRAQCTTTYDNHPVAQNISIGISNIVEPYKIPIEFIVTDREAEIPGHRVAIDKISYRLNPGEWRDIDPSHLTGVLDNLFAASSINQAKTNQIIFNTLPYFSGEQKIEFRIRLQDFLAPSSASGNASTQMTSNSSEVDSRPLVIFPGMASISTFENRDLAGCELQAGSGHDRSGWISLLFLSLTIGIGALLRREIPTRARRS